MSATHTPGPWKLIWWGNERYPYPLSIDTADDACWIARNGTCSNPADARLIAAAPDLLAALKAVMAVADRKTDEFDRARAAISKAESGALSTETWRETP